MTTFNDVTCRYDPYFSQDMREELMVDYDWKNLPLPTEIIVSVLSHLNAPRDLIHLSEVCKGFYFASKNAHLWEEMVTKFLSNVTILTPCLFSAEQQFKIIFQKMMSEQKPISDRECEVRKNIQYLSGFNGFVGSCYQYFAESSKSLKNSLTGGSEDDLFDLEPLAGPYVFCKTCVGCAYLVSGFYRNDLVRQLSIELENLELEKQNCLLKFNDQEVFEETIHTSEQAIPK